MARILKLILGYSLMISALYYAFYSGKQQGHLICIDFNVLPFVQNAITISVCGLLITSGLYVINTNKLNPK